MSEWISVNERVPDTYDKVLVLTKNRKIFTACYRCRWGEWALASKACVTHWMPMPDLPEEEV